MSDSPKDFIEVLMVEPGQYPKVEQIGADLASMQKAVEDYIEVLYPFTERSRRRNSSSTSSILKSSAG